MNRFFFSHPYFYSFILCASFLKSTMTKPECVLTDSVAYLRFLGRNINCGGWRFHFGCELLGWAWWSEWLLFGRDFHWRFALQPFVSLFILFLHHGQFGAGFDRDRVLLLGRRTYDILWHAASSRAWTAFFGKCGECWFFIRAFTSLDEHKYERYIKQPLTIKVNMYLLPFLLCFFFLLWITFFGWGSSSSMARVLANASSSWTCFSSWEKLEWGRQRAKSTIKFL